MLPANNFTPLSLHCTDKMHFVRPLFITFSLCALALSKPIEFVRREACDDSGDDTGGVGVGISVGVGEESISPCDITTLF